MYVPASFAQTDGSALRRLLVEHPFATLVTVTGGEPTASHVPLLWVDDGSRHGALWGHVARANPQWRSFAEAGPSLAIFAGAHAYVSPRTYATAGQVPTWNYAVVHAYGTPVVVDASRARVVLASMVEAFERGDPPWSMDELGAEALDGMLQAIVAFELPIDRLEGKWKVGQNRLDEDRRAAAAHLAKSEDPQARAVAAMMRGGEPH